MDKIFVVIPAYEPDTQLIELCKDLKLNNIENIVVVNDGSVKSVGIFDELRRQFPNIIVLEHQRNMGKGRALKTAFSYLVEKTDSDGCITADSDGQHKPEDILKCIKALSENPDSLVLGCRQFNWKETPLKSKIGNRFTLRVFRDYTKHNVSDTQTGLRGLPRKLIKEAIDLEGERFEYEMNVLVTFTCKYKIKEVPIACVYNANNKGTHFRPFKDSLKVIRTMKKAAKVARKGL